MNSSLPYSISVKQLLLVHAIVPVLFLVWLSDIWLFGQTLQPYLQLTATTFAVYLLFFELPHVIASFISYADKEYVSHYRKRLLLLPLLIVLLMAVFWYNFTLGMLLYIFLTMYHVIRQQTGIAGLLLGGFSNIHKIWTWLAIITYTYGFILVSEFSIPFLSLSILFALTVAYAIITLLYALNIKEKSGSGWQYFLLTSIVVFSGFFFLLVGYSFLAIFVIRFVHDVTAFIFYTVHDSNRNFSEKKNIIYKLLTPLNIPILVVTPAFALIIAFIARQGLEALQFATLILVILGFVHYFIESFMWRRDSLHRQYIYITK